MDAKGGRNARRQAGGVLIGEGITIDGHFLFILLEDIGRTKGGVGEGRANRGTRGGTGTKGRLLAGRRWCLDNLCLDDAQDLPNLTTNRGNDHRNLVEEVTAVARTGQV